MTHVLILGAGQAAMACAVKLRKNQFSGKITLLGDEATPPYQRPPLSKGYLLGEVDKERLRLRPQSYYDTQDISLKMSARALTVDPSSQQVRISGGEVVSYDELVFATGAGAARLPSHMGGDLNGVYTLRSIMDVDNMAPAFKNARNMVVVGGGYIGLEIAAVASKCGLNVTLIEAGDRILKRVSAVQTSDYFRELHTRHGVKILENISVQKLVGEEHVHDVLLSDGQRLAADLVVAGVGCAPNVSVAEDCGVAIDLGITCDEMGRTNLPHIWAAGDCASSLFEGQRIRIESVGNAIDQAENVACNIMGQMQPYVPKPWFWSDQYACKLQIAGMNTGYTDVYVRAGQDGVQSHWYYREGRLICVDAMNDPRSYMVAKRLIESGKSPDPKQVVDPNVQPKELLLP